MTLPFSKLPSAATISPKPFQVSIPQEQLDDLQTLLKLSRIAPPTYENSQPDRRFGITSEWLTAMREQWKSSFDWRACEERINRFPQFTTQIEDINVHFAALFSEKPDAVPIVLIHGWPGSYLEFLPVLELFRDEFNPSTLPYHLIVPSLPGYVFSSGPPLDRNFTNDDSARILDQLMKGLGFSGGYVSQGGDIGSRVSRILAVDYESCKAAHLNFCPLSVRPEGALDENLTSQEKKGLELKNTFLETGAAYSAEHGTRPATIGHVLSSSPIALLTWIGEKYLEWVDEPLPSETILELVSLYWFTETFARCIYPYRERYAHPPPDPASMANRWYIKKPLGFSYFPVELFPVPKSWGGHFAALEKPKELKADLSDEDEVSRLEELSATYDPEPYWSTIHPNLLSTLQHNIKASARASPKEPEPTKRDPMSFPEARTTLQTERPSCGSERNGRSLNEPVLDFMTRLPPSTTKADVAGPWIFVRSPDGPPQNEDLPSLVSKGTALLHEYEDRKAQLEAWHHKSGAKTRAPLTRALNPLRQGLEKEISALARETDVVSGKWMLFLTPHRVDEYWEAVAVATVQGELGFGAKVATDDGSNNTRLLAVYTRDYEDKEDVKRVLEKLVELGLVKEGERSIYYKCDAYTYLQIMGNNPYGLKPSLYASKDVLAGKI
ncbi:hypothetical protein FE257_000532 [Aspergillus nanangensis]|uniref:Epoxide hydrolase N-terminal domain-containing protein n=1 Tax=Aspergillus nanangensis TaxID=2582783 RepID=A0AAD4CUG3_ASPNN|nr:hypothetical protein FE257_000532 [Aspergillus nanangensis]